MGVTIKVNGACLSLVHKGSMGIAKSTLPDVCKTPSPGGPVPIPYPVIVSFSKNLKKGSKTVKVDGKNSVAVKGSQFSRCMGDEPGTLGGVVSSTNMKEAKWILYSFDVKMDGKSVCRLSDKMIMNHGNTVCMMGIFQPPVLDRIEQMLCEALAECEDEVNQQEAPGGQPTREWCNQEIGPEDTNAKRMGRLKDTCAKDKIQQQKDAMRDSDDNPLAGVSVPQDSSTLGIPVTDSPWSAYIKPDVVVRKPDGSTAAVYDFKTSCPLTPDKPVPGWGSYRSNAPDCPPEMQGKNKKLVYQEVLNAPVLKRIHANSPACSGQMSLF